MADEYFQDFEESLQSIMIERDVPEIKTNFNENYEFPKTGYFQNPAKFSMLLYSPLTNKNCGLQTNLPDDNIPQSSFFKKREKKPLNNIKQNIDNFIDNKSDSNIQENNDISEAQLIKRLEKRIMVANKSEKSFSNIKNDSGIVTIELYSKGPESCMNKNKKPVKFTIKRDKSYETVDRCNTRNFSSTGSNKNNALQVNNNNGTNKNSKLNKNQKINQTNTFMNFYNSKQTEGDGPSRNIYMSNLNNKFKNNLDKSDKEPVKFCINLKSTNQINTLNSSRILANQNEKSNMSKHSIKNVKRIHTTTRNDNSPIHIKSSFKQKINNILGNTNKKSKLKIKNEHIVTTNDFVIKQSTSRQNSQTSLKQKQSETNIYQNFANLKKQTNLHVKSGSVRHMDSIGNIKHKELSNISNGSTTNTLKENIKTNYDTRNVDIYNTKNICDTVKIDIINVKNGLKDRKKKTGVANPRKHFYILPKKDKESYFGEIS